jgi:hypothetical protein
MNGVMVGEVEARIALRINLSCLTQWDFLREETEEAFREGHGLSPVT